MLPLVLFCALSDAVLIVVGVGGVAPLMVQYLPAVKNCYLRDRLCGLGLWADARI